MSSTQSISKTTSSHLNFPRNIPCEVFGVECESMAQKTELRAFLASCEQREGPGGIVGLDLGIVGLPVQVIIPK